MSKISPKLFTTLKGYTKKEFVNDVTAGIIVAIIALPLSIALAIASGVTPEKGLHTAIIAGFLISMLGGSRVQIGGPTGAFMVIVFGIVTEFGLDGLIISTILAGIIMVIMGLMKLGGIIKFIPFPITTGFTSGIALVIFSSQVKDFLGLRIVEVPVEFLDKWIVYIGAFNTIHLQTALIGLLALFIIIIWPKFNRKIPGALVALIVTSVIVNVMNLEVATIGTKFGELSSKLPVLSIPEVTFSKIRMLILPAFTIAVLGSIESLLSAVVADGMIGSKHRSDTELVAQGVANIASGLFGGIPATGAIARTVANIKNGATTPVAGMVHSITLLLIMVIFMPMAKMIPLTSLAAVLIIVAYNMSEWREFLVLFRAPKADIAVLLTTFSITVMIDLVKAIEVGIVLAAILFMKRMADVSNVNLLKLDASEEDDTEMEVVEIETKYDLPKNIQIYEINGPFFFGAVDKFLPVLNNIGSKTDTLVVRMRFVPAMDATALHAFRRMVEICTHDNIRIIITGMNEQPLSVLKKAKLYEIIGEENFFTKFNEAIESLQLKTVSNI